MEPNKWYIKEQCERIRGEVEAIELLTANEEALVMLENVIVAAYKIEADVTGKDLSDLVDQ